LLVSNLLDSFCWSFHCLAFLNQALALGLGLLVCHLLGSSHTSFSVWELLTSYIRHYALAFFALFRLLIALALALASDFDDAPHARRESNRRVGLPFESRSGPLLPAIRDRKLDLLGLSPDFTGALRVPPL